MFGASSELAPNIFGASSELASVMEFGFNSSVNRDTRRSGKKSVAVVNHLTGHRCVASVDAVSPLREPRTRICDFVAPTTVSGQQFTQTVRN